VATVSLDATRAGNSPVKMAGGRGMTFVTGKFSFDNNYPTGGEDISEIFNQFRELLGIWVQDPANSAGTGKRVIVDYAAKKLLLFDNAAAPAQVANASDQSGAANLRFIAWGYF
jgi:hypothetical protein